MYLLLPCVAFTPVYMRADLAAVKYTSRIELQLTRGIHDSFIFQQQVYGSAAARVENDTGVPVPVLGRFYTSIIAPKPRTRQAFLRQTVASAFADVRNTRM